MEEWNHIWLENNLDLEQIIELMEGCDKNCKNCTTDEQLDCRLERRESIHAIAKILKQSIKDFLEIMKMQVKRKEPETMVT